ncbi:MAG TPA: S9 family peptidase [Anaerolineae bacterium]|nr:S9 family peptidase [Anaerolineae bacterium]
MPKPRFMSAEHLYDLETVMDARMAPNGRSIIYTVQHVDRKTEKKYTNLWLAGTTSRPRPRQFTYGNQVDRSPRWSPDGRMIAFLSNRGKSDQFQIYLIPIDGGEARPLTSFDGSISSFAWSPDGKQLVVAFRTKDEAAKERDKDEQKKKLGVVARHIKEAIFRIDGAGYLPEEKMHIWTVKVSNGQATQLTSGMDFDERNPVWSPDGRQIAFVSNREEDADIKDSNDSIYVMSAEGAPEEEWVCLSTPYGSKGEPSWSPDGEWIAYTGRVGPGNWWTNSRLWVVPADGTGAAEDLSGHRDIHISNSPICDTGDGAMLAPTWSNDSQRLFFQVTLHGSTMLCAVNRDGSEWEEIIGGGSVVHWFSFDDKQEKLAYVLATLDDPCQVYLQEMGDGEGRRLTKHNYNWLKKLTLSPIEEVWIEGDEGHRLQGWIIKPPDFDSEKEYPSILEIHGGPWLLYGHAFTHEFYYLAAQGYVVHCTNPRGGMGYGEAHSKAIQHSWGKADYADIVTWTDYIESLPYIDASRMGITGGSYGGYMTLWAIGHTHRFKAAVAQRVVSNAVSFWASSDVGLLFEDPWADNVSVWQDITPFWEQSPMKYIGEAKTPTLIMHSENDLRCDMEQGVQAFRALRQLGVDTELVLFPEESHGLSRIGRTDRRIVRLEHIVRWFETYL